MDNLLRKVKVPTQLDKCSESLENFEENCERSTVNNFSISSLSYVVFFSPLTYTMSDRGKSYHRNVHRLWTCINKFYKFSVKAVLISKNLKTR